MLLLVWSVYGRSFCFATGFGRPDQSKLNRTLIYEREITMDPMSVMVGVSLGVGLGIGALIIAKILHG